MTWYFQKGDRGIPNDELLCFHFGDEVLKGYL